MMKQIWIGIILSVLSTIPLQANHFYFLNPSDLNAYRFSFENKSIEKLDLTSKWMFFHSIESDRLTFPEIPLNSTFIQIPSSEKNVIYFYLNCTNQIFCLNLLSFKIFRLDKTYYRGDNCLAYRFFRNGELFSLGGYGFWRITNHLIRFDKVSKEFEGVNTFGDSPSGIYKGFTQYLPDTDEIISFSNAYHDINVDFGQMIVNHDIFKFSFKTKIWEKIGEVNLEPLRTIFNSIASASDDLFFFTGKYFIVSSFINKGGKVYYFIDPKSLKVYQYHDNDLLLVKFIMTDISTNSKFIYHNGSILVNYANQSGNQELMFLKIDLDSIFKKAVFLGYLNQKPWYLSYWFFTAVGITLMASVYGLFKKKFKNLSRFETESPVDNAVSLDLFDYKTKEFLIQLCQTSKDEGLDMDEVNRILGLDGLGLDAQRYKRSAIMKEINNKLAVVTKQAEPIKRIDSVFDKRQKKYQLNPDVIDKIAAFLKD